MPSRKKRPIRNKEPNAEHQKNTTFLYNKKTIVNALLIKNKNT